MISPIAPALVVPVSELTGAAPTKKDKTTYRDAAKRKSPQQRGRGDTFPYDAQRGDHEIDEFC